MKNPLVRKLLPHVISILTFILITVVYFSPQLKGKKLSQDDIISYQAASQEMREHVKETGERTYWTNSMFGGMPVYAITMPKNPNLLNKIEKLLHLQFNRPIGYFLGMMICFYIMMLCFGVNPWIGLTAALAFGLSTQFFLLFEAGHSNKLRVVTLMPLIIGGMQLIFKKKYLIGLALFGLGIALNINANHIQMTYYLAMCLLIWTGIQVYHMVKEGEQKHLIRALAMLAAGAAIGVMANVQSLWINYDYAEDTMRGKPILEKEANTAETSTNMDGLEWNYATRWSNGVIDLFATFSPWIAGGANAQPVSKSSKTYDVFRRNRVQQVAPGEYAAPLYWGPLNSTVGPFYMGAALLFLLFLGFLSLEARYKWWLLSSILLLSMLSLGRNFEFFTKLFYNYAPLYNKFRTPNSIMTVTAVFVPLMAFLGLNRYFFGGLSNADQQKKLKYALYGTGGFILLAAVVGLGNGFASDTDARYDAVFTAAFEADRKSLFFSSLLRTVFFAGAMAAAIWAFLKEKVSDRLFYGLIALIVMVDLLPVNLKYLNAKDFKQTSVVNQTFEARPVDNQILSLEDSRGDYRVLDLSVNVFNSSMTSYYHNTIGGYSAAKLQRYQDIIDRHISSNNMKVLNMLNTKYFITSDGKLQTNPEALGTAWFVDNIVNVQSPNQEIDALGSFDPATDAVILTSEFDPALASFDPNKGGSIELTSYEPDHLVYKTSASSEQFAVFSEIWYGPNKGWQAYIDGEPVDHVRVNYILRGMRIPSGDHEVEFKFMPRMVKMGGSISWAGTIIILLLIAYLLYQGYLELNKPVTEPATIKAAKSKPARKKKK